MKERRLTVWPPLPAGVYWRAPANGLPYPLGEPDCRLYAWGRHALWHGLHAVGLRPGDEVLVPAYNCGSEVEVLVRAEIGCRFYEGSSLQPDAAELERLLRPKVRALYLIHYLGFPQDASRWRRWCDERGLLLLEDAGHALLSRCPEGPVGSFGDLAIFCLYKCFGLPHGGALLCRPAPPPAPTDRRLGVAGIARRHGAWLAQRSRLASTALAVRGRPPFDPVREFSLGDPESGPWASVPYLLRRLVNEQAAVRRRANYRRLLEELRDIAAPPFTEVDDGASPLAFPVETENKESLMARLGRHGVEGMNLWSVPHPALRGADFADAARRRATTVALPIHQELSPQNLDRIAMVARGN